VTNDESQPKPELFLDLIRRQQRGRLKIYLGFAAGVGKTFDMLQEGNRLRRQGVDVVIGFVEAHARPETIAQIGALEQVPRRRIEYHGIVLEEMDLDAVLQRQPTVVLVELKRDFLHGQLAQLRQLLRREEVVHRGRDPLGRIDLPGLEPFPQVFGR
jgi:K+-sensing histidine kinase KdpD